MDVSIDGAGQTVAVSGRLDVSTVAEVRTALQAAVDSGQGNLYVDLRAVEILDATGLGVLMGVHRRALAADRTLVLRGVPERLARLLHATRLDRVLQIERVDVGAPDVGALLV